MKQQHPDTTVNDCKIMTLESHANLRGNLTVAQNAGNIPFNIKRLYYIFDIPSNSERGGHSHYSEECMLVAVSGCFDVVVNDGFETRTFTLRKPNEALFVPPGLWRTLGNFSSGCVALALSSMNYDESDYVRDFDEFIRLKSNVNAD